MKKAKSGRKNRSVICKRVARPDLCGVVARDRCSTSDLVEALCERSSCTSGWCACRHASPVSTVHPGSVQPRRRRLSLAICLRKRDGFLGDLGLVRSGLGLALPDQAEELPMEAGVGCLAARSGEPAARCERALLKAQGAPVPSSYRLAASPAVGG